MTAPPRRSALQVLMFFPRGGSAQVVRYLARDLVRAGWRTRIVAGGGGGPRAPRPPRAGVWARAPPGGGAAAPGGGAGPPPPPTTRDGVVNTVDVLRFLNHWSSGC